MTRTAERVFDELLVSLAQAGDREALARLAARWRARHYAHARRLTRSADIAADAVQDAWASIVGGLKGLNDPARFPAWSYSVVTRRCRDLQRRAGRAEFVALDEEAMSDTPSDAELTLDLRRALAELPPDQSAAIALFYRDGFSIAEIAQALCIPQGTVKTRLFHARRALRRQFEGEAAHEQA